MADYRIICRNITPMPNGHRHIGQVGLGDESGYTQLLTTTQVINAMTAGDRFYTVSPSTNKVAMVTSYYCPQCQGLTLHSAPDAVTDNNLDNLTACAV